MNKTTEALKLAEEALKYGELYGGWPLDSRCSDALAAIREAQAEQDKQEPVVWISVADQMPKSFKPVLVRYWYELRYSGGIVDRVIRAQWIPAKTEESNDDDHFEYDEETDTYYVPEGWYELVDNWDEYSSIHVCEGEITHWMPLPEFPNAAPVDAKAIRAEALEEAAKWCEAKQSYNAMHANTELAAGIRGLK